MQAITDNWREVALVADDEGRVVGVVTDGDIRRGLLSGLTLDSPVGQGHDHGLRARRRGSRPRGRARPHEGARASVTCPSLDRERRLVGIHFLEALLGTADKPNAAVIMAGGEGRRLRPLTDRLPKPMVQVAGRPILERIVLHLVGYGIKRIHISVNYLAEMITDYFGDGGRFGCRIEYLRESLAARHGRPALAAARAAVASARRDERRSRHAGGYLAPAPVSRPSRARRRRSPRATTRSTFLSAW